MRTVLVRKLPDDHYNWLREQAVANGRSMEAELRALVAEKRASFPKPVAVVESAKIKKGGKKRPAVDLLTAKERRALKPDAQAALQRLRAMFADRKGQESKSMVDDFLAGRRKMWGDQ